MMELTVFPKAKPHPTTSDEKRREATKCLEGKTIKIKSEEDLFKILTENAWSPSVFNGNRHSDNFSHADFMALDVDEGLTLLDASNQCKKLDLSCLIAPSPSYKAGIYEKFRMVFPLSQRISSTRTFSATWDFLKEKFPAADPLCKDAARFYFGSKPENSIFVEGDMLSPITPKIEKVKFTETSLLSTEDFQDKSILEVLYGEVPNKIPESVDFFLRNAHTGLDGQWNHSLNACVYTLSLQGLDLNNIYGIIENVAPNPLDSKDNYCINRAYKNGQEKRT